jgi:arylsulfatase A-like enzyme
MPRRLLPLLLLAAAAAAAAWHFSRPAPPRFNVVLISIDSLVRDRLGVYGHRPLFAPELEVSPNLDALAEEGVVFEDAHTTSSWTLPSHMALLTGMSDSGHEVTVDKFFLDPLRRGLAQEFQRAGATTAGFYSGPYLDPVFGFGRGFDVYESGMMSEAELKQKVDFYLEQKKRAGQPVTAQDAIAVRDRLSHVDITSPRVNRKALDFLDGVGDEPFFLFLHYFDAHYDYMPNQLEPGLGDRFDPDYRGERSGMNWMFDPSVREVNERGKTVGRLIGERDLQHVLALYDAEIHYVDRHIGEVLRKLRQRGLWENTIVCVTSDHGDEFFEHGSIGHRSTLFPEQTEMALVLRVPEEVPPGRRVPDLVRSYDVAPTLLDYCGLAPLAESEGESLRPLLEGGAGGRGSMHRMFGDWPFRDAWRDDDFAVHRNLVPDAERMQQHPDWLFVRQAYSERDGSRALAVFDRREDPDEQRPLPEDDPRFAQALARFAAAFDAAEARRAALPRSVLELRYTAPRSAETQALLDGLGYTDSMEGVESGALPFPQVAPLPRPGEDRSSWTPGAARG